MNKYFEPLIEFKGGLSYWEQTTAPHILKHCLSPQLRNFYKCVLLNKFLTKEILDFQKCCSHEMGCLCNLPIWNQMFDIVSLTISLEAGNDFSPRVYVDGDFSLEINIFIIFSELS